MPDFVAQLSSVNLIKDLLIPALAAVAGLWVATRKFRKERIWQEKYSAYQTVLASIEAIRYWADEEAAGVHMLPTVGYFDGKDAQVFYAQAKREVAKQAAIGTILLSEEFVVELAGFQTELFCLAHDASEEAHDDEREQHFAFGHHASQVRDLADRVLPRLIQLARKDVGA
jgi:hypothetical protein